jgi:tetratricopeptide (TPR) repeat protein
MAHRRWKIIACIFLVLATLIVYGELRNHQFISLDDDLYVTNNPPVQGGLTLKGLTWAFTTMHAGYWIPLTWLSHMLDCQLFGLHAGGHHLVNLLFHIANTLLLFLWLLRITHALGPSFLVAALFALHPLHVESVAWAAERKDVLSTFFWLLTMWAYVWYAEVPGFGRYLWTLICFSLGLMAKPMLVTLPFVLLLLDYWPLGRWPLSRSTAEKESKASRKRKTKPGVPIQRLVWEKVPMLVLAALFCMVTFYAQKASGAVNPLDSLPLTVRIANALVAYVSYMGTMLWPSGLAVFYPHPRIIPQWQALGAGLTMAVLSLLIFRQARRHPYLLVGWLWYLGTLVPVIGLVQVGQQALADRFTYVPLTGLFIILAWGALDLTAAWRHQRIILATGGGIMLSVFTVLTWFQVGHWRDIRSLFEHAINVTANNYVAYSELIEDYGEKGEIDKAIDVFQKAVKVSPDYYFAYNNLGAVLANQGRIDEALPLFQKAVQLKPDFSRAYNNLGMAYDNKGEFDNAIAMFQKAIQIDPYFAGAYNNLGIDYANQGKNLEAIAMFKKALEINPNFLEAYNNLGLAFVKYGDINGAIIMFQRAIQVNPNNANAHKMLSILKNQRPPD